MPVPCLWIYRDAHSSNYNNKAARFLHRKLAQRKTRAKFPMSWIFFYRMAITCIIKFSQSCVQWQLELDVASVRRRQRNTLPACNKNIGFFDSYSQFFPRHHSFCDFWSLAGNLMWKVHWLTNVIISESIFYSVGLF